MRTAPFLFVCLFLVPAATWKIPVYGQTPMDAADAYSKRDFAEVLDGDSGARLARSCADLVRAKSTKHFMPEATDAELRHAQGVEIQCETLRLLMSAKAPKQADKFTLSERAPDELPPCLDPVLADGDAVDVTGKTLRSSSATVSFKNREGGGGWEVSDPAQGYAGILSHLGQADFNNDGLDDTLLVFRWRLTEGRMSGTRQLILSRKPGEKILRVVSDSDEACKPVLPPPAICTADTIKAARSEFQRRYDAKQFESAYELLDGVSEACREKIDGVPAQNAFGWLQSDLAITAHQLGRDARCMEITRGAALQDSIPELTFDSAVRANLALCEKSLQCTDAQIKAARNTFKKSFDKGDIKSAIAQLGAFADGCEGSGASPGMGWVYSDLAFAAKKAGDLAGCSAWLDRGDTLDLGSDGDDFQKVTGALATNRRACPRPEPVPVSTPITKAPWAGQKKPSLTWIGYCEGDVTKAAIVSRAEAATAKAPFCVRFDPQAFDPNGIGADGGEPAWDSMSLFLLVEGDGAHALTVSVDIDRGGDVCDCDPACKASDLNRKAKPRLKESHTPALTGGRALIPMLGKVSSWDFENLTVTATAAQKSVSESATTKIANWPLCM